MFGDMGKALKQARDMQGKMAKIQEELGRTEVQGTAGGGQVQVTLNGKSELVRCKIDPQALADGELLEDLIAAAHRDAQQKVQEITKQIAQREMGPLAGLLGGGGIPGL